MKKYIYFVSYWGAKRDNSFSFGSAQIAWGNKLKTLDDIRAVHDFIREDLSKKEYDCVTVLNFQLLRVVKEKNSARNAIKGVATELKRVAKSKGFAEYIILSMIVGLVSFYFWKYVL